jgi:hypothetical protein
MFNRKKKIEAWERNLLDEVYFSQLMETPYGFGALTDSQRLHIGAQARFAYSPQERQELIKLAQKFIDGNKNAQRAELEETSNFWEPARTLSRADVVMHFQYGKGWVEVVDAGTCTVIVRFLDEKLREFSYPDPDLFLFEL